MGPLEGTDSLPIPGENLWRICKSVSSQKKKVWEGDFKDSSNLTELCFGTILIFFPMQLCFYVRFSVKLLYPYLLSAILSIFSAFIFHFGFFLVHIYGQLSLKNHKDNEAHNLRKKLKHIKDKSYFGNLWVLLLKCTFIVLLHTLQCTSGTMYCTHLPNTASKNAPLLSHKLHISSATFWWKTSNLLWNL